jgi:hypothetical protein
MHGNFIAAAVVCAFALLLAFDRRWTLKKTRDWRPIVASVTAARTQLLGEASTVFVDVVFSFNGLPVHVRNVMTDGDSPKDYPGGCQIRLLVNPYNPKKCMLEKLVQRLRT